MKKRGWFEAYRNIGVSDGMPEYEKRSYYIFNVLIAIVMAITCAIRGENVHLKQI